MRFVQFDPRYCEEARGVHVKNWDSSHDVSVIYPDGARARAGTFKHAEWAQKFQDMMNKEQEEAAQCT